MADKITQQTFFNNNDGVVAYAEQIKDRDTGEMQSEINKEVKAAIEDIPEGMSDILTSILDKLDIAIANDATMTDTINDISGKVTALDTKLTTIDGKIDSVNTKLTSIESRLEAIETILNIP